MTMRRIIAMKTMKLLKTKMMAVVQHLMKSIFLWMKSVEMLTSVRISRHGVWVTISITVRWEILSQSLTNSLGKNCCQKILVRCCKHHDRWKSYRFHTTNIIGTMGWNFVCKTYLPTFPNRSPFHWTLIWMDCLCSGAQGKNFGRFFVTSPKCHGLNRWLLAFTTYKRRLQIWMRIWRH